MGLDNYPEPYPCTVLEEAGKLTLVRDADGDPECKATNCPFKRFPTGCWIRGKVFNPYIHECCDESLYEDKTRADLERILQSLKERYTRSYSEQKKGMNADADAQVRQLIEYLDTLLSIQEWDGKFIAWF